MEAARRDDDELEARIDSLYALPLADFITGRNDLVKALRRERRRDEAGVVAGLRKPSAAAWAVDQVARLGGDELAELLEAGAALRSAHAALLDGSGDATGVRAAVADERAAVRRMAERAAEVLAAEQTPASAATQERIRSTLHAVATDDEVRALVERGRLDYDGDAADATWPGGAGAAVPARRAAGPASRRRGKVDPSPADGAAKGGGKTKAAGARADTEPDEGGEGKAGRAGGDAGSTRTRPAAGPGSRKGAEERRARAQRLDAARKSRRAAERELKGAEAVAERGRASQARAEAAAADAEDRVRAAQDALDKVDKAAQSARRTLKEAEAEAERRDSALRSARSAVDEARRAVERQERAGSSSS